MGGKEKEVVSYIVLDMDDYKGCDHKRCGILHTRLCTNVKESRQEWHNAWPVESVHFFTRHVF